MQHLLSGPTKNRVAPQGPYLESNKLQQKAPPTPQRPQTRSQTRSQPPPNTIYPIGTRVNKRYKDRKWYDGTIKSYNPKEQFYKVIYDDGDSGEYTHVEIAKMIKQAPTKPPRTLPAPRAHSLYIPTPKKKHKLQPIPHVPPRRRTPTTPSTYSHGYKHAAKALMLQHMAMAGGSIWDEELQKFAAYRDLSKHPNTVTRHR